MKNRTKLRAAAANEDFRKIHPKQAAYYLSEKRFNVVPAGRRSGKTAIAKRRLRKKALMWDGAVGTRFIAAAPVSMQAKRIYWQDLKAMCPLFMRRGKINETEKIIPLVSGADIQVIGMDEPARVEGSPIGHILLDEYGNMKEGLWDENVYPALIDSQGTADLIGVPEGRNHYYKQWVYAISGKDEDWVGHTWFTEEVLPLYLGKRISEKEIRSAMARMDPLTFRQEFRASFEAFEGQAYYCFDRDLHASERLYYNPNLPLVLCFDFNVSPGVAVYCQEDHYRGKNDRVDKDRPITKAIGEVWIPKGSNTKRVCQKIISDWGDRHKGLVYLYGDATGGNKGTAKVEGSDWDIIWNMLRPIFGEKLLDRVEKANPKERSRVNAVNTRLMTADEKVHALIDPVACEHLCVDLDSVVVLEGTDGELDKDTDPELTHITDAWGYYIVNKHPVSGGDEVRAHAA